MYVKPRETWRVFWVSFERSMAVNLNERKLWEFKFVLKSFGVARDV